MDVPRAAQQMAEEARRGPQRRARPPGGSRASESRKPARTGLAGSWAGAFSSAAARHVARVAWGWGEEEEEKCRKTTRWRREGRGASPAPSDPRASGRAEWKGRSGPCLRGVAGFRQLGRRRGQAQGAVAGAPLTRPLARIQDSHQAIAVPFLNLHSPACLGPLGVLVLLGERLDQGEAKSERIDRGPRGHPRGVEMEPAGKWTAPYPYPPRGASGPSHCRGGQCDRIQTCLFCFCKKEERKEKTLSMY